MKNNYIFIDFENIQPEIPDIPENLSVYILLFIGAKQSKISLDLAIKMKDLGEKAKFISLEQTGKNALDFLIVHYIGEYFAKDPEGYFHIISKDSGFDPLIEHLQKRGISITRYRSIENIPVFGITRKVTQNDIADLIEYLDQATGKPSSIEKLINVINTLFKKAFNEVEINKLIFNLELKNYIRVENNKVIYLNVKEEKVKISNQTKEVILKIKENLSQRQNRPARIDSLKNFIKSFVFKGKEEPTKLNEILKALEKQKVIQVSDNGKVSYNLKK